LASAQAMRELVASSITAELLDLYRMYAAAGVEDFAWMNHHRAPANLEELREFARRSGKETVSVNPCDRPSAPPRTYVSLRL
jgi:hypothetical protein